MKKTHKIRDLEQVRLLADPFKLRLLQAFAAGPRTAKQVARDLDEPVTKLYRHVDALHDAGLLEIVDERRKRGAIERTFRAIAGRFEVDHALFAGDAAEDYGGSLREVLRAGERELLDALARADDGEHAPIAMRLRIKANPARIAGLRRKLLDWIEEADADDEAGEATDEAGALIAFYPIRRA